MTVTARRTGGRRLYQGRRPARVYAYLTLKVDARGAVIADTVNDVEVGYVGQTVQSLAARDGQHNGATGPDGTPLECQPWYDLVYGGIQLVAEGYWSQRELDAVEQHFIHTLRPRYNIEHNLGNANRVTKADARAQREIRDRARGVRPPVWAREPATTRSWLRRPAFWWVLGVAAVLAVWVRLLGVDRLGLVGALVATAVTVGLARWGTAPQRPRRRRR